MRPDLVQKKDGACPYRKQIRLKTIDYSEAKGPVYARALQGPLIKDEEFCLQADAHSKFKKHYDELLLADWYRTENENAVLTTYVMDIVSVRSVCSLFSNIDRMHDLRPAHAGRAQLPLGRERRATSCRLHGSFSRGK